MKPGPEYSRPSQLPSVTRRIAVGCGSLYVTTSTDEGYLVETIVTLGKSGGCASSNTEALSRAVSLGLKRGVSVDEYIEELQDIRCPNPLIFPKDRKCLSCADGYALALKAWRDENGNKKNA